MNEYDIRDVCVMFGVTSRTLRFYEEKGIIGSVQSGAGGRRRYTDVQIERIRCVLVLRSLGISVQKIRGMQLEGADLRVVILRKKAEILASIERHRQQIHRLDEALSLIEAGENLYEMPLFAEAQSAPDALDGLAAQCAEAIVTGDTETLYRHLSAKMIEYMPRGAYEVLRRDTLAPLGGFARMEQRVRDEQYPQIVYQYVRYEKMGLKIKLVFHSGRVSGLWMNYCEL